jgi:guanosine-3',5'-bis(diphosphate) 3'-pyrophosphohydrolase
MTQSPGIDAAAGRSDLIREALEVARHAHAGQTRTGSGGRPYIEHPVAVAERLAEAGYPDVVLAAALLHDVVEDSELTVDDIRERFGDRVAELVDVLTEDASIEPHELRKKEHRERVGAADPEALAIFAADKLTNVSMLRSAYEAAGEQAGDDLKVPLDDKARMWELDLEALRAHAPDLPLVGELSNQLAGLADDRAAQARP